MSPEPTATAARGRARASATRSSATARRSSRSSRWSCSRPSSAATSSPTRTSTSPAGCRCSGKNYYTLKADFQTAQAVTPGQGQAVTIAGAKVGEIASVDLHDGVADGDDEGHPQVRALLPATRRCCCARRRTLQDMTVEVNPGTPVERAGCTAAKRCPLVADRAEHRLRRIPGGPGRRNARSTCRSCWRAPGKA